MIKKRALIVVLLAGLSLFHALPIKDATEVILESEDIVTRETVYAEPVAEIAELETDIVDETEYDFETENDGEIYDFYETIGEFYITAYCPCEECCGYWATLRNGNSIVTGASGEVLTAGYSVAADTSIFPFGTFLYIDGKEYKVSDTGGKIKGNRLDVYFATHEEALGFAQGNYLVDVRISCD